MLLCLMRWAHLLSTDVFFCLPKLYIVYAGILKITGQHSSHLIETHSFPPH